MNLRYRVSKYIRTLVFVLTGFIIVPHVSASESVWSTYDSKDLSKYENTAVQYDLNIVEDLAAKSTISRQEQLQFKTEDKYFKVFTATVPVYDNSGGTLHIVGYLTKGQVYPRVRDYGDWHQIKFGSKYGYVWEAATTAASGSSVLNENKGLASTGRFFKSQYDLTVYDNSKGSLVPFASIVKGEKYPIIADWGDWLKIDVAGRIGFVYKPAVKMEFLPVDKYFKVVENNVPVYDNSGGVLKPVGSLIKGQVYPRVSDYGDWHQIKFGNQYGYVWAEATVPSNGNVIRNPNTGISNSQNAIKLLRNVSVYDNSGGELNPFGILFSNQTYPIISSDGIWIKVDVGGRMGYIFNDPNYLRAPFDQNTKYFKVIQDTPVYDNSTGKLVPIGKLEKDFNYYRVKDYGDWHEIFYAGKVGYVWKDSTAPASISKNQYLPILAYHNFTYSGSNAWNMTPEGFRAHMEHLKKNGYTSITYKQFLDFINNNGNLPSKPVMITIDDGYYSVYQYAYPILKELGMKATVFPIVGAVGSMSGTLRHFNWEQAKEMEQSGVIDIQSHSFSSHYMVNGNPVLSNKLPEETDKAYLERIRNDLYKAKTTLESMLNKRITALAYPYGSWNEAVKQTAKDIGYEELFLYNVGTGPFYKGGNRFMIDRFEISGNYTAKDVYRIIQPPENNITF